MPATSLHKLYWAKSLTELDSRTKIEADIKKKSSKLLANSATKVFIDAEKSYAEHDEEKSYVQYMRFIELVLMLKDRSDFKKDDNKILMEKANIAISKAELLKESLKQRYSELHIASPVEVQKNIVNELPKNRPQSSSVILEVQNEVTQERTFITSADLLTYLTSQQPSLVIMDIRPQKDFLDSHIKHSCCINIPQEVLTPGLTAAKLESLLPKESLSLWYKRDAVDLVVIMDFDSKNDGSENQFFTILKAAMSKWDQKRLKKTPVILKGGYKDWMAKFPMHTTKVIHFEHTSDLKMPPVLANLADIEYPDLDDNVSVEHLNEKNVNDKLFKKTFIPAAAQNGVSSSKSSENRKPFSAPAVDRKSKPSIVTNNKPNSSSGRVLTYSGVNRKKIEVPGEKLEKKIPPPVDRKSKAMFFQPATDKKPARYVIDSSDEDLPVDTKPAESVESVKARSGDEEVKNNMIHNDLSNSKNMLLEISNQSNGKLAANGKDVLDSKESKNEDLHKNNELESHLTKAEEKGNSFLTDKKQLPSNERGDEKASNYVNTKKREISSAKPILSGNSSLSESKKNNYDASVSIDSSSVPRSQPTSLESPNKGLVRSHSSPNITHLLEEEENRQCKIPIIDRSLKPKMTSASAPSSEIIRARQRNLNPVYGNCPVRPATGLKNLGNTCFMNSVIQCLSNTFPLADYIMTGQYVDHVSIDYKHGTGGELVEEFAAVIKALWMGQYKSIYPRDFKNTVSKCLSVCIGNEQQDSHEFLVLLLEKLHADLNRRFMKVPPKLDPNCNEAAFWQHHKSYNSSKISDIFEGMLKSTLVCLSCRKVSHSFEVTTCLSLPISTSKCSLKDCFKNFLRPEKISGEAAWDCPRCKQKKEAEKRLSICRVPEVLIIHLKRFSYEGLWRRKLQSNVDFDLSFNVPFEENSHEYSRLYSLYGIVNHYGTMEGGHYTAYCKTNTGKWFKYDDHEVSEISSSDIKTSAAYLLFYIASDFQSRL